MNSKLRIALFSFLAVAGLVTVFTTTAFSEDVPEESTDKVELTNEEAPADKAGCEKAEDCKSFCEANPEMSKAECQAACESACEKECTPAEKQKCESTCSKVN